MLRTGVCAHCRRLMKIFGRGLCQTCYMDRDVRLRHPTKLQRDAATKAAACRVTPTEMLRAFNDGCQARIEGKAVTAVPNYGGDGQLARSWREGYWDVHGSWGSEAKITPATSLPEVVASRRRAQATQT